MTRGYYSLEAMRFGLQQKETKFNLLCLKTRQLLNNEPAGLNLPSIQKSIGMSNRTAKLVLARVAVQKSDKFFGSAT